MQLDYEMRAMLIGILKQRQADERRRIIAQKGKNAIDAFQAGQLKEVSAKYIIKKFGLLD